MPTLTRARPSPFTFDVAHTALIVIDMQRDFVEPGGFGEALGNDVSLLTSIVPTVAQLIEHARDRGWLVVHTRESHAPDLSDCPDAKRLRGAPRARIGDMGPMGRILVRGEPGNAIVDAVAPITGEIVIDKPGKGAFTQRASAKSLRDAASRISCSQASRPKYACRRACAKRTIAATNAC